MTDILCNLEEPKEPIKDTVLSHTLLDYLKKVLAGDSKLQEQKLPEFCFWKQGLLYYEDN